MRLPLLLLISLLPVFAIAQKKKVLSVDDFAAWHKIEDEQLSNDGRWAAYVLEPNHGDPTLVLYNIDGRDEQRFPRADEAHFTTDGSHLIFRIHPAMDSVRQMKLDGTQKDDLPSDTLAILTLASGAIERIPDLKKFEVPEKWGGWLVYGRTSTLPDSLTKGMDKKAYQLVIRSLGEGESVTVEAVRSFTLAEESPGVLLASDGLDSLATAEAGVWFFDGQNLQPAFKGTGDFQQLSLSRNARQAAWVADLDTTEVEVRPFELYSWSPGATAATTSTIPTQGDWMPDNWRLSEHYSLQFSHDESRLYFGIAPVPVLPDSNLLEEERVQVEVWTTSDPQLYTVQELRADRERKRSYDCVLQLRDNRIAQLATAEQQDVDLADRGDAPYALATNEEPYLIETMWESGPARRDIYRVDVSNGDRELIAKALPASPDWSPDGKFLLWYNFPDTAWFAYDVMQQSTQQLTSNELSPFYDELNDRPMHPYPEGTAGWTSDDRYVIIEDRFDLWQIDPTGEEEPRRLTEGREQQRSYRYIKLDPDERHLPDDRWLLHFHDEESCREGYAWLDRSNNTMQFAKQSDHQYSRRVIKARDAEAYLFTRENFQDFPDLRFTKGLGTRAITSKISNANPQQAEYRWGTIEHYYWTSPDGQQIRGLLVKPEGFDPNRQYPLIVNFYERYSHTLHRHRTPEAHRSTINYANYVSKGYVIFNPDVPYRIGYPGESAYNAVMSGVTSLLDEGFIDRERVGVQGHSWGGYQIAHLLTKTDLFRCAEAGAPVVNMFSAYGGIRWGSGLSRQFQYEQTQSRIGGTPWEYHTRYLENSPLFFMDKVNTPVLILHNDNDGAVPWYQGIEYFTALRRLGKPAWFLNYNGEPHWPLKWHNRLDFQRRMGQFFDHFLLDAPLPRWMDEGVPAHLKGVESRYEAAEE